MAVQILPIIKALAPYIAQVATAAIPAFTSKPESAKVDPLVSQQIEELQEAVRKNAESIHVLAESLQKTVLGVESVEQQVRAQVDPYKTPFFISVAMFLVAMAACAYVVFR